ncbi:MAG: hypothetical protein Q8P32_00835 [Candidatus Komeilibacteria bacterium]|nr:hypothetical protein [Candidatus Komeilibacteria bacterium]
MSKDEKKKATIQVRKNKDKLALLENLKSIPIIEVACSKASISRATYYRWRDEDEEFCKNADEAIAEGEKRINDMSESQLISLIKDRSMPSIAFWLRHHHPKYSNKLEVVANINNSNQQLTPEQQAVVEKALTLAFTNNAENSGEESKQLYGTSI